MSALNRSRIVCLLSPVGCSERDIAMNPGSISIIGHDMFTLLRVHGGFDNIGLYDPRYIPGDHDILIIMMCLPDAPMAVIQKFKTVVYFFDDMNEWKAREDAYRERLEHVDLYLSPVKHVADRLNALDIKPSFHIPWSMPKWELPIVKTPKPSVLIDMDDRDFVRKSIDSGFAFARLCLDADIQVVAFDAYRPLCPDDLRAKITFCPLLSRADFLRLLSHLWIYATGIGGSYEYSVLESALLGCGLVSIDSALQGEHAQRRHFLAFDLEQHADDTLKRFIADYRPQEVIADAERLYPRDAVKAIKPILAEFLQTRSARR